MLNRHYLQITSTGQSNIILDPFLYFLNFFFLLAVLGLCCSMQGLLQLWHAGLVALSTWDLSSPTRDQICVLCIGRWILIHWTTREVPIFSEFFDTYIIKRIVLILKNKNIFILSEQNFIQSPFLSIVFFSSSFFFFTFSSIIDYHKILSRVPCAIQQVLGYLIYSSVYIGEGNGTPLQYSCLENPMDGGAWQAAVHGVARSWTRLSDFTFTFHFPALEKEMATHSSVLAWRIPGTGEPGGLPSMGSHRVRHD